METEREEREERKIHNKFYLLSPFDSAWRI